MKNIFWGCTHISFKKPLLQYIRKIDPTKYLLDGYSLGTTKMGAQ